MVPMFAHTVDFFFSFSSNSHIWTAKCCLMVDAPNRCFLLNWNRLPMQKADLYIPWFVSIKSTYFHSFTSFLMMFLTSPSWEQACFKPLKWQIEWWRMTVVGMLLYLVPAVSELFNCMLYLQVGPLNVLNAATHVRLFFPLIYWPLETLYVLNSPEG